MKIKFNRKMVMTGIISFLVIAASICFYYLIFRSEAFSAKIKGFFSILSPVIYGIIIAYLLTPIVNYIERKFLIPLFTKKTPEITAKKKKYMRVISVILSLLLISLLLYAFISVIVPEVSRSIIAISYQFPYYIRNLTQFSNKLLQDNPTLNDLFIQFVDDYSGEFSNFLNKTIIPQTQEILKHISLSLLSFLKTLWNVVIGAIISVYVLFNKELFAGQAKKIAYALLNTEHANTFIKDIRFTSQTFIGFLTGKIIDSIIIGILCFIGLSILKMPYAILVSVIVGVTNVIPFFGPYLGAIPSALLILLVNPLKCLYFIIFILILQQLDGNVIGPKILGQSTGLSGFWVIFSITIFGGLWGVAGMIVGVPLWAVIYALVKRTIGRKLKNKGLPSETQEYLYVEKIKDKEFIMLDPDTAKKSRKKIKQMNKNSDAHKPVNVSIEKTGQESLSETTATESEMHENTEEVVKEEDPKA